MIKLLNPLIVRKIWGGRKLEIMKGIAPVKGQEPVGETWEICDQELPYLAKFIDTSDELSIQVHPGDEFAKANENSLGKTECWIILEAAPKAGIYLGLRPGISKNDLEKAITEGLAINELLNFYEVSQGDFFYVPAGSIHAIGKDITLAEVQQNSGITYRVWDWNRLDELGKSRELHVEKSLAVINFDSFANQLDYFRYQKNLFESTGVIEICSHPNFHLFLINMSAGEKLTQKLNGQNRPSSILNLAGKIKVNQQEIISYGAATMIDEDQLHFEAIEEGSLLLIL